MPGSTWSFSYLYNVLIHKYKKSKTQIKKISYEPFTIRNQSPKTALINSFDALCTHYISTKVNFCQHAASISTATNNRSITHQNLRRKTLPLKPNDPPYIKIILQLIKNYTQSKRDVITSRLVHTTYKKRKTESPALL